MYKGYKDYHRKGNNIIIEDYVSFEVAKLLREKGFDEIECNTCYKWNGNFCNNRRSISGIDKEICYQAPTHQMALKWLREVHKYLIVIGNKNGNYLYLIKDLKANTDVDISNNEYVHYEDACEAAIEYCLTNII